MSTCWKGKSQLPATSLDLLQLEFCNDTETRTKLTGILNKYVVVFSDKVGRTKLIEHEILLKDPSLIALKPYPYPQQKQAAIDDMVRNMETARGLFQFRVLPFGLKNSPMTFVRLINEVMMRGYQDDFVQVHLDNIIVFSRDEYEHQAHLNKVLGRLKRFGLTCNTKKCKIGLREISFLGHIVDSESVQKQPEKFVRSVRKFLGVCNWYNQFGVRWKWKDVEQRAFKSIKNALVTSSKLSPPDYSNPFCLQTDASEIGASAVLFQRGNRPEERRIVSYASKKFSETQKRYAAVERECLAITYATDKFRPYLETQHIMSGQNADKWQQVADLLTRLGLVSGDPDTPQTAVRVNRMSIQHLLQDPVWAAIYNRGWADWTADIQRRL
ncbi:hypothetical protein QTP88_026837 [Uroleucon formosanum]